MARQHPDPEIARARGRLAEKAEPCLTRALRDAHGLREVGTGGDVAQPAIMLEPATAHPFLERPKPFRAQGHDHLAKRVIRDRQRIVAAVGELLQELAVIPLAPEVRVDAVAAIAEGEIAHRALEHHSYTARLGLLQNGVDPDHVEGVADRRLRGIEEIVLAVVVAEPGRIDEVEIDPGMLRGNRLHVGRLVAVAVGLGAPVPARLGHPGERRQPLALAAQDAGRGHGNRR